MDDTTVRYKKLWQNILTFLDTVIDLKVDILKQKNFKTMQQPEDAELEFICKFDTT